jgi:hypothetical protein
MRKIDAIKRLAFAMEQFQCRRFTHASLHGLLLCYHSPVGQTNGSQDHGVGYGN